MKKNAGFTLIELLVVVLIIGILAAVALPQYTKAVEKTRLIRTAPLIKSLASAQNAFILSNGTVARSFADLPVALPAHCTVNSSDHYGETANCRNFQIFLDAGGHYIQSQISLSDGSDVYYASPTSLSTSNSNVCMACGDETKRSHQICKSLGGIYQYTGNCSVYKLP